MLASLRKPTQRPSTLSIPLPLEDRFWHLAEQVLTSEGGLTLLFIIPAMVSFFVWASLPPL